MAPTRWLALTLLTAVSFQGVSAQDVEMLGQRFGTRPPDGYYRELARNPNAFRFTRGRASRARQIEATLRLSGAGSGRVSGVGGPALALGPRGEPVVGTYTVPLLLGLFTEAGSQAPYPVAAVHEEYFGASSGTVTEYYAEVSNDSLTLLGDTRDWIRTGVTQAATTQGQSALVCCGIGAFIKDLISRQVGVDWGLYDNDGPDGNPDSGDDDGFVDALAVMHPTQGAECGGSGSGGRIWSHKWTLTDASPERTPYVTTSARFGGGFIRIEDYFVQGALACDASSLNAIGIFAHETGHAFGLPDLYDTRSSGSRHQGAGNWDLMSTGTWGCNGSTTERPCHMGAWSKAMLGWVDVVALAPDTDLGTLVLPPVETSGTVYRVDAADGSGEYFLLENRQEIGYDQGLRAEGLFIWQIDADSVLARWSANRVNASAHMGVWLRQADGLDDLGDPGGNRSDAGDPFPGQSGNTAFHAGSNPASTSFPGTATGLTVLDIAPVGNDVSLRVLTRFTQLTVTSTGTTAGATDLFTVDGSPLPAPPANFVMSAPFASRTLEAAAGEVVQPGERNPFVQWSDAPAEPRTRTVTTPLTDTNYVAAYGGTQYQLLVALTGGVNGVTPGSIVTTPVSADLWFAPATSVQVTAVAQTGFSFQAWTGTGLSGQPNPANVVMSAPVFGSANFQLIYSVADAEIDLVATDSQDVQLAVANGTAPVAWDVLSGSLPTGLALSGTGRLTGASLDVGAFPVTVQATDALGLVADATLTLDVSEPSISIAELASPFLLGGPALDAVTRAFLDHQGNANGAFDLGDFRAWVLAHPSLPLSASLGAPAPGTITLKPRGESR